MKPIYLSFCLIMALLFLNIFKAQCQNSDSLLKQVNVKVKLPEEIEGSYILAGADDKITQSGIFNKGSFILQCSSQTRYQLQISSLGYHRIDTMFNVVDSEFDINLNIQPNVSSLKEVTISANLPVFEKTSEGTKVNVENSLLSKCVNSAELLSKVPGITISASKALVFGKGEAIIILNSKEISYQSFKSLPPSDIKSIEIIYNPDARYDSKANAVIMVTMKKHYNQGTGGTFTNALTCGFRPGSRITRYMLNAPNVNLQFRKGKLDLNTYYANENGYTFADNNYQTDIKTSEGIYSKTGYYTEDNRNKSVHYYRCGIGYKLNSNSYISTSYDGLYHDFDLNVSQNSRYSKPSGDPSYINMYNKAGTTLKNHSVNLNYNLNTDTLGSYWCTGLQYNNFQNLLLDNIR